MVKRAFALVILVRDAALSLDCDSVLNYSLICWGRPNYLGEGIRVAARVEDAGQMTMRIASALLGATLASMSFIGDAAQASVVDFENYAGVNNVISSPTVSGGYSFGPTGALYEGPWFGNPYTDNGTESLIYGYGSIAMSKVGGGAFDVSQLDSGLTWYTSETSLNVTLTGNVSGGGTITDTFTIGDGYQTYHFSNLNNLTSLSFSGAPDGYIALDNISVSGVPEPSTWAMLLLGIAGLGFTGYRRANKGRSTLLTA